MIRNQTGRKSELGRLPEPSFLLLLLISFVFFALPVWEFWKARSLEEFSTDPGFFAWLSLMYQSGGWLLSLGSLAAGLLVFLLSFRWRRTRIWTLFPLTVLASCLILTLRPAFEGFVGATPVDLSSRNRPSSNTIRILHANIYRFNDARGLNELIHTIEKMDPDIVVLHELEKEHLELPVWRDSPDDGRSRDAASSTDGPTFPYPYRIINTEHPYFGYGVFSRYPLRNARQVSTRLEALVSVDVGCVSPAMAHGENSGIRAACTKGGSDRPLFRLISSHPVAPFNTRILGVHHRALNNLVEEIERSDFPPDKDGKLADEGLLATPILVTGDFNSVDWSSDMLRLHRRTELHRLRPSGFLDFFRRGTFPSHWPSLLRIPIDGFYISRGLKPLAYSIIRISGSDHMGLIMDFEVRDSGAEEEGESERR